MDYDRASGHEISNVFYVHTVPVLAINMFYVQPGELQQLHMSTTNTIPNHCCQFQYRTSKLFSINISNQTNRKIRRVQFPDSSS